MRKGTRKSWQGQRKSEMVRQDHVEEVRKQLKERMRLSMMEVVYELFEEEKRELCGEPWSRKSAGKARSGGTERGSIYLEGRRVPVRYPRVAEEGRSHALSTYKALGSFDMLAEEVQAKLLRGVSTRDYDGVISQIVEGTGLSRTTVSKAFIRASKKALEEINGRDLRGYQFVALFFDGIGFGKETILVVGMGVTEEGDKVLLGLVEGHTENADVVSTLLDNLVDRKLALADHFLAVVDGSKALRAALLNRWRGRVMIQRCQQHKKRNVTKHLPPKYQAEVVRRMNVAYGMAEYEEALKLLKKTADWLGQVNESAASSLKEGMEETLTVVKLGLPHLLRQTFSSTNPLESVFDGVRYRTGRVKRWRRGKGQMMARWAAAAGLEVERRLRKIRGHRFISLLAAALNDQQSDENRKVG